MLPPWTWDAVTTDCKGKPEVTEISYVVTEVVLEPAGFIRSCALDEETAKEICVENIVYYAPVLAGVHDIPETQYDADDAYTPGLGGVTFVEAAAKDGVGHLSTDPCE